MRRATFRREWLQSGTIEKLLALINDGTELNSEGSITFTARDHSDLFYLLADGIEAPASVTRGDISSISYRSFIDLRKTGPVGSKELISEICKRTSSLEAAPKARYTMWTKCRLSQMSFNKASRFDIDGVSIRTAKRLPEWLLLKEHFISGVGRINPNVLHSYGFLIFTVDARNESEAAKVIFDACDKFFAVVNTSWRSIEFWTQRASAAKLWVGPHQFFFCNRKFLGENRVWYNQSYDAEAWERFPPSARDFIKRSKSFRQIFKALEKHPLKSELYKVLILISEGMISPDLAFRLMRFWSAAEALYAQDGERSSTKKLIDRLVFASKSDDWIDRIKLERCYHLRNSYVHKGSSENDDSSLVQHLRETLLTHVYYYINQGDDINTHSDLIMMVDLPADQGSLERRSIAIQRRINIAKSGRHRV